MTKPHSKQLLEATGLSSDWPPLAGVVADSLPGETPPGELPAIPALRDTVVVEFGAVSDGRGFSMAPLLRSRGYTGRLIASGQLIPDQLSMLFQCGYDGVVVTAEQLERYGPESWSTALVPTVDLGYARSKSVSIRSIWQEREAAER